MNRGRPTNISLFMLGAGVSGGLTDHWEKMAVDPAPVGRKRAKKLFEILSDFPETLARVVEGWNRHEAERTEVLRGLQEERQAAELTRSKQQEVCNLGHGALERRSATAGWERVETALESGFMID